ncbi:MULTISPECIES: DNA-processing protein DprA [unclassified Caballeronia]|uniref:DNA-processing protein DprA n=1 Tax=unclassified Caballeronia TaxID=2646786 RepID=UPI001F2A8710|nr:MULTISPECIES: DNA-processing protein DprA [unclassified Caballeronia]MCE4543215.1 DNA-processing protein DprA [Caballeronia sp. PC1]MCE4567730.1 DNA-processing protein DprA [Caballeronia sp. CLC5]
MTTADMPTGKTASTPDAHELRAWLRLAHAKGLKPLALRALLGAFGGPLEVLSESFASLTEAADARAAEAVLAPPSGIEGVPFDNYIEAVLAWASEPGNHVLTFADAAYPQALLTMPDPPPLLYAKGRLDLLQTRAVAIVGSRHATPQGLEDARRFARAMSDAGLAVASGLALGIDASAHRGALEGAAGTVAVIGTGIDLVYPAAHHTLAHEIARDGAMLSEWPLGTPARSANFPQRNRLIAGLSSGVLIVEAAMRSGSLITARLANEMGRDVFALPGSIHAPLSQGCHRLIKQGAKLVETPEDVLEEFGLPSVRPAAARSKPRPVSASWASARIVDSDISDDAACVLDALGHAPATLEILAARTGLDGAALQAALLPLELAGQIAALAGGRYTAVERS